MSYTSPRRTYLGDATGAAIGTAVLPGVGTTIGTFLPVASVIKTSAAGPNQQAASAVLPLALQGNAAAIKAIYKRATYIQTASSAAPWKAALNTIQSSHPSWVEQALQAPGIQEEWVMNVAPEQVLPQVQRYNVYVAGSAGAPAGVFVPGGKSAAGSATGAGGVGGVMQASMFGVPLWLLLAGGAAVLVFKRR